MKSTTAGEREVPFSFLPSQDVMRIVIRRVEAASQKKCIDHLILKEES